MVTVGNCLEMRRSPKNGVKDGKNGVGVVEIVVVRHAFLAKGTSAWSGIPWYEV